VSTLSETASKQLLAGFGVPVLDERTATFVFFAGDRFHGVITAHVAGPESANYSFTSSLPVQVLRDLAPVLEPVFAAAPESAATVASTGSL